MLKPENLSQLPLATWSPLRAALEEGLVDRGGILNFAHDFLRSAVEVAFVPNEDRCDELRLQLADDFEQQPTTARSCDELPWLLWQTESFVRLRACLLNIDCFLEIFKRDRDELRQSWLDLNEERAMGASYLTSFEDWSRQPMQEKARIAFAANELAYFLIAAALYADAEPLMRRALFIDEQNHGPEHPSVAIRLNNLAQLLKATSRQAEGRAALSSRVGHRREELWAWAFQRSPPILNNLALLFHATNRLAEAEPLMRRALAIWERSLGTDHPHVATGLSNLALLLQGLDRWAEAEQLYRRVLTIRESSFGPDHPDNIQCLNNLATLLRNTNRLAEAELLMRRALAICEKCFGQKHPHVATVLNNLSELLGDTNRLVEAESFCRRALTIRESSLGPDHPEVASSLNNLAGLLLDTNRSAEAELHYRRALAIDEKSYGLEHPDVARDLNNLAVLLKETNRLAEAELLYCRALTIYKKSYGPEHTNVAIDLNNLAELLRVMDRLIEAEPLLRVHYPSMRRSSGLSIQKLPRISITLLYCSRP